jgi:GMP synthase (glutamine-hydrolysing)
MQNIHKDKILIIDFGSQYTQLIARRVRETGVYCEVHLPCISASEVQDFAPRGVIISGGPESVNAQDAPKIPEFLLALNIPLLGICYGMQSLAAQLGGSVASADVCEFGHANLNYTSESSLFKHLDLGADFSVWMSHGDHVTTLPDGFICTATSDDAPIAAMEDATRKFYALQFHPEVTHTPDGEMMLRNFVCDICACQASWQSSAIIDDQIMQIKQTIGSDHVVVGLSGGVDSSVVAALLQRAIGSQLTCVFVDTGLMRAREVQDVQAIFADHMGIDLITVDAADRFFAALQGESDPERKRKICGELFVRVFEEEAKKIPDCKWLGQGTIYSDVIESAKAQAGAHVIKSHHNVGGLPEKMGLKLIEPLAELFKDEVRKVGSELGVPDKIINRHPFPGPGLIVRVLGEVKREYVEILRRADDIFITMLHESDLYNSVSQAFAVFLPVKSVGVTGDQRNYAYVIALRAVKTTDFMTATWADLPHDFLSAVSNRIINSIPEVSRVVYDISGKPPATIEWE